MYYILFYSRAQCEAVSSPSHLHALTLKPRIITLVLIRTYISHLHSRTALGTREI
jgi:hypothetical protein